MVPINAAATFGGTSILIRPLTLIAFALYRMGVENFSTRDRSITVFGKVLRQHWALPPTMRRKTRPDQTSKVTDSKRFMVGRERGQERKLVRHEAFMLFRPVIFIVLPRSIRFFACVRDHYNRNWWFVVVTFRYANNNARMTPLAIAAAITNMIMI